MESAAEAPHYDTGVVVGLLCFRLGFTFTSAIIAARQIVCLSAPGRFQGVTYHSVTVLIRITEFRLVGVARPRRSCAEFLHLKRPEILHIVDIQPDTLRLTPWLNGPVYTYRRFAAHASN